MMQRTIPRVEAPRDPHRMSDTNSLKTVAVIISHLNSARTIRKCVQHVLDQDYPRDLLQVIVVDAGSQDGSIEIVKQMECENMRQIIAPRCTESEGQTLGIRSSESDVIMFTNSDIYVPTSWVRKHLEWLGKGYDLVGGKVFWGGDKFALTWNMPTPKLPQHVQQQGLGLGFSNCSVRRIYLDSVGGLKNLRSQHDTEFAFRVIRTGGMMVLDPKIEVYHDHPFRSMRGSFLRSMGYAFNHVIVMRASYGQLVSGSGSPAIAPAGVFIKELTMVNAMKTYRQNYGRARERNILVSPLEFGVIRLLSTKLGLLVGIIKGAITRNVSLLTMPDLHKQTEEPSLHNVIDVNFARDASIVPDIRHTTFCEVNYASRRNVAED